LNRRGAKAAKDKKELDAITPALMERAGERCERCRSGFQLVRHHKRRRSQGGENTLENVFLVCTICHEDIHAYREGWADWLEKRGPN
jgi:5-methylcytosine-specific restriction endonuclease McrA